MVAYQYKTEKYDSHGKLENGLNAAADDGWEPIHYAVTIEMSRKAWHYVILRRSDHPAAINS